MKIQNGELEEYWVPNDTRESPYWPWALQLHISLWGKKVSCVLNFINYIMKYYFEIFFCLINSTKLNTDAKNRLSIHQI